ncbi:MAG: BsuPI-related putative proteinase inhibitor [Capsulimonadales bacterium]|nr:BsuPI-related putative proteinase inhibitor [Capsulimonadales bacterium]
MRNPFLTALLSAVLSCLPWGTHPAHAQNDRGGNRNEIRQPIRTLEAALSTDRTQYGSRGAVRVTMTLTNLSDRRHSVNTGGKWQYDFLVRNARTGKAVFTLSRNWPRLPNGSFTLEGGASRTYRELWDRTDDSGKPLPSGVYVLEARLFPQDSVAVQIYLGGADSGNPPEEPGEEPPTLPGQPPRPGQPQTALTSALAVTPSVVAAGSEVTLNYSVRNGSSAPVTLRFSSGQRFDAIATNPERLPIWQLSRGMMFTQALGQVVIPGGETRTFTATWTVPPDAAVGRYSLNAFLTPMESRGRPYLPASAVLTVGRPAPGTGDSLKPPTGGATQVSARVLVSPAGATFVGRQVTLVGRFNGRQGGNGAPPVTRNDWVLASEGVTLYVTGKTPLAEVGSAIVITGTVRRTADGRIYLESN